MTVEIYGKDKCGYCEQARAFFQRALEGKGVDIHYAKLAELPLERRRELVKTIKETATSITYPIIKLGEKLFFGFSEDFWRERLP